MSRKRAEVMSAVMLAVDQYDNSKLYSDHEDDTDQRFLAVEKMLRSVHWGAVPVGAIRAVLQLIVSTMPLETLFAFQEGSLLDVARGQVESDKWILQEMATEDAKRALRDAAVGSNARPTHATSAKVQAIRDGARDLPTKRVRAPGRRARGAARPSTRSLNATGAA